MAMQNVKGIAFLIYVNDPIVHGCNQKIWESVSANTYRHGDSGKGDIQCSSL